MIFEKKEHQDDRWTSVKQKTIDRKQKQTKEQTHATGQLSPGSWGHRVRQCPVSRSRTCSFIMIWLQHLEEPSVWERFLLKADFALLVMFLRSRCIRQAVWKKCCRIGIIITPNIFFFYSSLLFFSLLLLLWGFFKNCITVCIASFLVQQSSKLLSLSVMTHCY